MDKTGLLSRASDEYKVAVAVVVVVGGGGRCLAAAARSEEAEWKVSALQSICSSSAGVSLYSFKRI